jgi:hypothetical protein
MKFRHALLMIMVMVSSNPVHAQVPKPNSPSRTPASSGGEGFVSFFGKKYKIRTPSHSCTEGTFNDHGQSVKLCTDMYGRPVEQIP